VSSNNEKQSIEKNTNRVAAFALLGITFIIMQGYFTAPSLDTTQFNAMIAFAIATPLLALTIGMERERSHRYNCRNRAIYVIVAIIGELVDVIGITLACWHISPTIGIVLIISIIVTFILDQIVVVKEDWSGTIQYRQDTIRNEPLTRRYEHYNQD
jgi:hypothetical protein